MDSQGEMLRKLVSEERFEAHAAKVRLKMSKSWTTAGMNAAMDHFFELLETDLTNLLSEGHLAESGRRPAGSLQLPRRPGIREEQPGPGRPRRRTRAAGRQQPDSDADHSLAGLPSALVQA